MNLENNINEINTLKENINKYNNSDEVKIIFFPKEDEEPQLKQLLKTIKNFGKIYKNNDLFLVSSIINNDVNKQKLIFKWIEEKINKNDMKFELIFQMSKNGTNCEEFHKKCDNKGPTIVLIQTTNNNIFGGFTPLSWKNSGDKIFDKSNQTFIFSLDLQKKYNLVNGTKAAIKCSNEFGPNFGNDDIELKKNLKEGVCYSDSSCSFLCDGKTELTGGKGSQDNFETKEVEVFRVFY